LAVLLLLWFRHGSSQAKVTDIPFVKEELATFTSFVGMRVLITWNIRFACSLLWL
jgi:hypothetical protein